MSILVDDLIENRIFWPEIENQFSQNFDFSRVSIRDVLNDIDSSLKIKKNINLAQKVLEFYLYNQYFSELNKKHAGFIPGDQEVDFQKYAVFLDDFSKKIFGYLIYAGIAESHHHDGIDKYSRKLPKNKTDIDDPDFLDFKNYKKMLLNSFYESELELHQTKKTSNLFKSAQKFFGSSVVLKKSLILSFLENNFQIPEKFKDEFLNNYNKNLYYYADFFEVKKHYNGLSESKSEKFNNFVGFIINSAILMGDINDEYSGDAQKNLMKSRSIKKDHHIEKMTVGEFLDSMKLFFSNGFDLGFAGSTWQDVIEHAAKYAKGQINTEVFIDQAMSLEHNNGNFFDKGFIFDNDNSYFKLYVLAQNGKERIKNFNKLKFIYALQSTGQIMPFLTHDFEKTIKDLNNYGLKSENMIKNLSLSLNGLKSLRDELMSGSSDLKYLVKKLVDSSNNQYFFDINLVLDNYLKKINDDEFTKLFIQNPFMNLLSNALIGNMSDEINHVNLIDLSDYSNEKNIELSSKEIGSKAKSLIDLMSNDFRVPKALVFDVKTSNTYQKSPAIFNREFKKLRKNLDLFLKDEDGSSIMVSVRSGAENSMPGMMKTILNVGIDDQSYPDLCEKYGKSTIDDCAISFMQSFIESKFNIKENLPSRLPKAINVFKSILKENKINIDSGRIFPLDAFEQIKLSTELVFESAQSESALAWKKLHNIDPNLGTAAIIQKMVLGNKNKNSLSGVVFSRDVITGKSGIVGEYVRQSQGESIVGGHVTPSPIDNLKSENPNLYKEIEAVSNYLEKKDGLIQDIEFTVEDSVLYILQKRPAIASSQARVLLAKDRGDNLHDVIDLRSILATPYVDTKEKYDFLGQCANPGVISGLIVKSQDDIEKFQSLSKPLILLRNESLPEDVGLMMKTHAFITKVGGVTSHAAIVARSLNKPCIVGAGNLELDAGQEITMDAANGCIWMGFKSIRKNTQESELISKEIIKQNNLIINNNGVEFKKVIIKSWNAGLKHSIKLSAKIMPKYKEFLSLNQAAASVFLLEVKNNKFKEIVKNRRSIK